MASPPFMVLSLLFVRLQIWVRKYASQQSLFIQLFLQNAQISVSGTCIAPIAKQLTIDKK